MYPKLKIDHEAYSTGFYHGCVAMGIVMTGFFLIVIGIIEYFKLF